MQEPVHHLFTLVDLLARTLLLAVAAASTGAFACRFEARPWADLLSEAPVVFIGKVDASSNGRSDQGPNNPATFLVQRVLKGAVLPGQRVQVATSNSSCGLNFTLNQEWMVLAGGQLLSSDAMSGSLLLVSEMGAPQKDNQQRAEATFRSSHRVEKH